MFLIQQNSAVLSPDLLREDKFALSSNSLIFVHDIRPTPSSMTVSTASFASSCLFPTPSVRHCINNIESSVEIDTLDDSKFNYTWQ